MILYLLRHAEAVDLAPDEQRYLSPKGREDSRALGRYLAKHHLLEVDAIWRSPYERATETAELLVEGHGGHLPQPKPVRGITPDDAPLDFEGSLQKLPGDTLLVSHNPFLSYLASWLLTGKTSAGTVHFKKASLMCLELHSLPGRPLGGTAALRWMITPAHYRSE